VPETSGGDRASHEVGVSDRGARMVGDQLRSRQRSNAKPRTDEALLVREVLRLAGVEAVL